MLLAAPTGFASPHRADSGAGLREARITLGDAHVQTLFLNEVTRPLSAPMDRLCCTLDMFEYQSHELFLFVDPMWVCFHSFTFIVNARQVSVRTVLFLITSFPS